MVTIYLLVNACRSTSQVERCPPQSLNPPTLVGIQKQGRILHRICTADHHLVLRIGSPPTTLSLLQSLVHALCVPFPRDHKRMSPLPVHHPSHTIFQPSLLPPTSILSPHPPLIQLMVVCRKLDTRMVRCHLVNLVQNTHNFMVCPPVIPRLHSRHYLLPRVFIPPRLSSLRRSLYPLDLLPETAHMQMLINSQQTDNRQPTTIQSPGRHLIVARSKRLGLFKPLLLPKGPRYLERTSICETTTSTWKRRTHNSVKCSHKTMTRFLVHLHR